MTDEQINALAREYAVEITKDMAKHLDESSCLLNETKRATEEYIADFMRWISDRYCIVEKSKLTEMYQANNRLKSDFPDSDISKASDQINHCLDCLFPELFKEQAQ